jgi:hypothetical protein
MKRDGEKHHDGFSLSPRRNDSPESFNLTRKDLKKNILFVTWRSRITTTCSGILSEFLFFSFLEILFLFLDIDAKNCQ